MHEIFAGLMPPFFGRAQSEREVVAHVQMASIEARPTPTPTPPRAAKRIISHALVIAPIQPHAIARTNSGKSAPKERIHRAAAARPKPPVLSHARPVWDIPTGAQGAGAGKKTGAGSLGTGGTGSGAATSGNGSGAAAGNEPCGYVEFIDVHGSQYDKATGGFTVDIRMDVHFPDGRTESALLDYPFYYPSEAANPWSDQNRSNPNFPTLLQMPPPDKRASEPPLVQYVIAHTHPDGYTLLKDCPSPSPQSSP